MMELLSKIIDAVLNNSSKSIIITIILLLLISLNLLGVDINYLTNIKYSAFVLSIVDLLAFIFFAGFMAIKLDEYKNISQVIDNMVNITEKTKDSIDMIETKINEIQSAEQNILNICLNISKDFSSIPNLKYLKHVFTLKVHSLKYDIFEECLTYVLTISSTAQQIIRHSFDVSIDDIREDLIRFTNRNIRSYTIDDTLSKQLSDKLDEHINIITIELEKEKKSTEKLYVISLVLKQMQEDMMECVDEYLQSIQADFLNNN